MIYLLCSADNFKAPSNILNQVDGDHQSTHFVRTEVPIDSQLETHRRLRQRGRIHERFLKYSSTVWLVRSLFAIMMIVLLFTLDHPVSL